MYYHTPIMMHVLLQLASMDWKLGISMSSNTCRALNSPYVSLVFTVVTDVVMGTTKQYSVELSMQQFQVTIATPQYTNYVIIAIQNFSAQLKEMSSLLETA